MGRREERMRRMWKKEVYKEVNVGGGRGERVGRGRQMGKKRIDD